MATFRIDVDVLAKRCYQAASENGWYAYPPGQQWIQIVKHVRDELKEADQEPKGSQEHAAEVRDAIMILLGYHAHLQQHMPPTVTIGKKILEKIEYNKGRGYRHENDLERP